VPSFRTLLDLLRYRANSQKENYAYTFLIDGENDTTSLTYEILDIRARTVAALLQQYAKPGERVLLLYPQGLEYLVAFWGCIYAGMIALPAQLLDSNRKKASSARIDAIIKDAQPVLALTMARHLVKCERALRDLGHYDIQMIITDAQGNENSGAWKRPDISPEQIAFLQYTSGSTSTPRGVMVSHTNVLSNHRMIQEALRHPAEEAFVSWLPLFHDMGLIATALLALYVGAHCVLLSPTAFLQKPQRWLRAISRYRAHTSGAPNFAYDLCARRFTPEEEAELDLSSWKLAFNGSEPIRYETMQRFATVFAPYGFREEAFFPSYGLAEATVFVAAGTKATAPVTCSPRQAGIDHTQIGMNELVGCGRPWLDEKLYIVDPQTGKRCSEGEIGEIWVAGPNVTQGYWQRPEETKATFRAYLAENGEGPFLRTGDLGFLKNQQLFITGRIKDLIIIRGVNYDPQDIEATVEGSHALLVPWACIAFSATLQGEERLVVVQEVQRHAPEQALEEAIRCIRQRISDQHGLQVYAVVLVKVGSLPKTTSGKVQRQSCKAKFLEDALEVVARKVWQESEQGRKQANESTIAQMLRFMPEAGQLPFLQTYLQVQFARFLGQDEGTIDSDQLVSTLVLDSLASLECCYRIEQDLGITLPISEIMGDKTITELAQFLLTWLKHADADALNSITPAGAHQQAYPLSAMQRGLWFLDQLTSGSTEYNLLFSLRFKGQLNVAALQKSLNGLLQRHPLLRARVQENDHEPELAIREGEPLALPVESLEHLSSHAQEAYVQQCVKEEARRPFDLAHEHLVRFHLLKLQSTEHVLVMNVHHIIFDGWSMGIFLKELLLCYNAWNSGHAPLLPDLPVQYEDYVTWQRAWLDSEACDRQLAYWRKRLEHAPALLNLPTDYPRPAIQTSQGAHVLFRINRELTEKLKVLARHEQTTLFTTLLAAFQLLLFRYSGQEDIIVGTPTAGRTRRELEGLIGLFVNTLAIRTDFSTRPDIHTLVQQVKKTTLEAFAHQDVPFEMVVEALQPVRQLSHTPIFQAMFTMQNIPLPPLETESFVILPSQEANESAQFDIALSLLETPEGELRGQLDYRDALFESETIQRMCVHFQRLLAAMVQDSAQSISSIAFLTPEEEQWLLANRCRPDVAGIMPRAACLHEVIARQARQMPQAIAVVDSQKRMTYKELEQRAHYLACQLRADGIAPEKRVGVCMERGADLVVAVLGILKAGGVYVPLDASYPSVRLAFMVSDARIELVLTSTATQHLFLDKDIPCLNCDEIDWQAAAGDERDEERAPVFSARQLAYIIYTSGSTGQPKGVAIEHQAAWTLLYWAQKRSPGRS
jgi:acyl-CoA synthetase (AMP-forming)/AMP-acid ligase II/acyl carrier protein